MLETYFANVCSSGAGHQRASCLLAGRLGSGCSGVFRAAGRDLRFCCFVVAVLSFLCPHRGLLINIVSSDIPHLRVHSLSLP